MTFTSEYGEFPALADNFFHENGETVVKFYVKDFTGLGRQKLADALTARGVDPNDVTGVIVAGVVIYERDKRSGHYQIEGGNIVTKEIRW